MLLALLFTALALAGDVDAFLAWADDARPAAEVSARTEPGQPRAAFLPLEDAPTDEDVLDRVSPGYRFAGTFFPQIAAHVHDMPGRVRPERIGTSALGRPIWAFHLQNPDEPIRRKVLVVAGLHAMEWVGTEVAVDLLDDLADSPLPKGVQVTIVPLANPDGRAFVERDLRAGETRYRRGNSRGVDLNRDFAVNREAQAFWRHLIPGYYRTSPGPVSQPETRALDGLAHRERFHRAASLHSFGGFFYTPWSGRFGRPERQDRQELWELGRAMEQAWGTRAYRTRQLGRWGFFFRAHGSEIDHLYGRYGTRAFLIEITRSGIQPLRPKTWKWGFRSYNPERPRRMRKHVDRTVHSLRALITHPDLPSEIEAREANHGVPVPPIDGDEA